MLCLVCITEGGERYLKGLTPSPDLHWSTQHDDVGLKSLVYETKLVIQRCFPLCLPRHNQPCKKRCYKEFKLNKICICVNYCVSLSETFELCCFHWGNLFRASASSAEQRLRGPFVLLAAVLTDCLRPLCMLGLFMNLADAPVSSPRPRNRPKICHNLPPRPEERTKSWRTSRRQRRHV